MVGWLPPDAASIGFAGQAVPKADSQGNARTAHATHEDERAKEPVVGPNWVVRSDLQRETQRWRSPTETSKSCQTVTALADQEHLTAGRDGTHPFSMSCALSTSLTALHVRMQV
jgi:hypothetical protein